MEEIEKQCVCGGENFHEIVTNRARRLQRQHHTDIAIDSLPEVFSTKFLIQLESY